MKELLKKLHACKEAREWAGDKTWEEIYNTCHRGDWLLWLFQRTNPNDKRRLVLVGAHCANTVRQLPLHLMLNERIKLAVDVAFSYGEGKATEEELADAAKAAVYMAAYTAIYPTNTVASNAAAANAAADAAICAASAAASAAAYAAAASAANAADIAADIAREQNQKQTADICRKYLPIEIWNIERGRK